MNRWVFPVVFFLFFFHPGAHFGSSSYAKATSAKPDFVQSSEEKNLRSAAEKGDAKSQYGFACAVLKPTLRGVGKIKESEKTALWLRKSAASKNVDATVPWFRKPVPNARARSMYNLVAHAKPDMRVLNGPKALYSPHHAATLGHAPAVFNLKIRYQDGVGKVPADPFHGYLWLILATDIYNKRSPQPRWLIKAAKKLTDQEKKWATSEFDMWLKQKMPAPPDKEPE